MNTNQRTLNQFRDAALLLIAWGLINASPSYAQLGHVQSNNWFEITKTPITCIESSVCAINGKLYMIGGELLPPNPREGVSDVRIYDIEADEWTAGTDMPSARPLVPKLNIGDKIYAIMGYRHDSITWNLVEVYDVSTDSWTRLTDLPTTRIWFTGCVYDGKIYTTGGISPSVLGPDPDLKGLDIVERYDPATDTWDTCAPMITGRLLSSACVLNDSLYVIGGIKEKPGDWPAVTTVEVYDPGTDKWEQKANMLVARSELTTVVLDGKIYAIGGVPDINGHTVRSSFEVYDPGTDTWTLHNDPEDLHPQGTPYHAINVNGRIYALNAVGSYTDSHPVFPEVYVYNKPVLKVKSRSLIAVNDTVIANVLEPCTTYIVPQGTPAKLDSIIEDSIISFDAQAIREYKFALNELSPGNYFIYAVALDGRIDLNYFRLQIVDHFPECSIRLQDAESNELIDSCLLVVNHQDTIQGNLGEFDLTGYAYDTCYINVTREGYYDFDTIFVIHADTSFVINLIQLIIESLDLPLERDISIFPNPTNGMITIQTIGQGTYSVEVINSSGQVVKKMNFSKGPVQVDLSAHQRGIYLIRLVSGEKVILHKVVKY